MCVLSVCGEIRRKGKRKKTEDIKVEKHRRLGSGQMTESNQRQCLSHASAFDLRFCLTFLVEVMTT